jgi:ribosome-binding factor A
MTRTGRREKRIAHLIQQELGRLLIEEPQDSWPGIITVTRVEMSADLMTARVYLSLYGRGPKEETLNALETRKRRLRRLLASRVNLKYNPELIFSLDPIPDQEARIDELIEKVKKHEP